MNDGKNFENNFKYSVKRQGLFIHRLRDTNTAFSTGNTSYTHENICDFFVFYPIDKTGILFALELKSTKYKSISIQREEKQKGMILMHQIQDLVNLSLFDGIASGFIFNFRGEDEEETFFLPIEKFSDFLADSDKSSINKKDIVIYGGYIIDTQKKRKNFSYDFKSMAESFTK